MADKKITLQFYKEEIDLIAGALLELPAKESLSTLVSIKNQMANYMAGQNAAAPIEQEDNTHA